MANEEIAVLEKELEGLRAKPSGSELVSVLNKLAFAVMHSDPSVAEAYAMEVLDLAENLGFPVELAKSYTTLGKINLETGKFTEAMSCCRKSMEIFEELGDISGTASVHATIANVYWAQGMIDRALEHIHESLRQKQECGASKDELASCHINIGACYSSLNRVDKAQSSFEFAREICEESGNYRQLAYVYHNLGSIYGIKEEFETSREYFQKALDIRKKTDDKKGTASTLCNLGNLHETLGDKESALGFFIRSLELYGEIGNKRGTANTCACIGGIYTAMGRLDEAEKFIKRGLEITRKLKLKDWEIFCLGKITDLYEAKGEMQKALMYSRELKTCLEEHMNEKSMEKIARLQVQFETEKKEKEAEIYRLKNVELSRMNDQLRDALTHVKKLQGMLPICASCKKVRDDDGYWQQIECYISENSDAKITHGICPECMIKLYGKDVPRQ